MQRVSKENDGSFKTIHSFKNNENSLNNNENSFITNSFNTATFNHTTVNDRSEILTWLSPLEPRVRHRDIGARRVDSIGAWVLETEEFRRWHNGSREDGSYHPTLFCDGNPGVGKSYIWYESMNCCRGLKDRVANELQWQFTSYRQVVRRSRRGGSYRCVFLLRLCCSE